MSFCRALPFEEPLLTAPLSVWLSSPIVYSLIDTVTNVSRRGGEEVLLDVGGQDATEAFEDVGHSDEAREILEGLLVGTLKRQVSNDRFHKCPAFKIVS